MDWAIGILIDVILILIIVVCAKKGSKDGFAKTLISFFGFFIALVLAAIVCTPVAEFCYDKAVSGVVETETQKILDSNLGEFTNVGADAVDSAVEDAIEKLPGFIKNFVSSDKLTESFKDGIDGAASKIDTKAIAQTVNLKIVRPALVSFFAAITFVVVFLICLILCKILSKSLKLVNKIPLLGKVNGLLGGILGALKGIIIVILINWIMVFLVGDGGNLFNVITMNTINSSLINNLITKLNPLNIVFSRVFHA